MFKLHPEREKYTRYDPSHFFCLWSEHFKDFYAAKEIFEKTYQKAENNNDLLKRIGKNEDIDTSLIKHHGVDYYFYALGFEDDFVKAEILRRLAGISKRTTSEINEEDQLRTLKILFGDFPEISQKMTYSRLVLSDFNVYYFPQKYIYGLSAAFEKTLKAARLNQTRVKPQDVKHLLETYHQFIVNSKTESFDHKRFYNTKRKSGSLGSSGSMSKGTRRLKW